MVKTPSEWLKDYKEAYPRLCGVRSTLFEPRFMTRDEFLYELAGVVAEKEAKNGKLRAV